MKLVKPNSQQLRNRTTFSRLNFHISSEQCKERFVLSILENVKSLICPVSLVKIAALNFVGTMKSVKDAC